MDEANFDRNLLFGVLALQEVLLRKAFERRLIVDPKELANGNLDPIRQRDDFQKLLS